MIYGIATPVCALARNDVSYLHFLLTPEVSHALFDK